MTNDAASYQRGQCGTMVFGAGVPCTPGPELGHSQLLTRGSFSISLTFPVCGVGIISVLTFRGCFVGSVNSCMDNSIYSHNLIAGAFKNSTDKNFL